MTQRPLDGPTAEIDALTSAVERLHGAKAQFVGSSPIHERFQGATVWQGVVSQFAISGHPSATHCYAWRVPAEPGGKDRFYAVLRTPEIDSPEKAVRASFVADARAKRG